MPNISADVRKVQQWLNEWEQAAGKSAQHYEQVFTTRLHQAIQAFQREVLNHLAPSGRIAPGDETERKLKQPPTRPKGGPHAPQPRGTLPVSPPPGTPLRLPHRSGFNPLSKDDYAAAAAELGCEPRLIHAVALQEGRDHGFDQQNRPTIMWEPVKFARLSYHYPQYRARYPTLTHLKPKPHPYGPYSKQYEWLSDAYLINPRAALSAPSWGKFQIRGENYTSAGYASVEAFVTAMCVSEQTQLTAFTAFINHRNLKEALRNRDFTTFANRFNGEGSANRKISTPSGTVTYSQQLENRYANLKD